MKFTLKWLKEHLETDASLDELSARLTMLGLEVEEISDAAEALRGFRTARVVSAEQHPNADRLRVCIVDSGDGDNVQVVCGAPNAAKGLVVPVALVGATLPNKRKFRKALSRFVLSVKSRWVTRILEV